MPATSKKQFRFMEAIAHGFKPTQNPTSLTPEKAKEYVNKNTGKKAYSKLREKVLKKKDKK